MFQRIKEYLHDNSLKNRLPTKRGRYSQALRQVDTLLLGISDPDERRAVFDFAIKTVKQDIISSARAGFVYSQHAPYWPRFIPVPDCCVENSLTTIDLSKSTVLAVPWDYFRLLSAIRTLHHAPFDQQKSHYTGDYYPELDITALENGQHHVAVASLDRGGTLTISRVCHLPPAFELMETDGAYWFYPISQESPCEVEDFRFALLYTLAKRRYEIKQ